MNVRKRLVFGLMILAVLGCTPEIAVKAPEKPLEINLNVKVDHNITVKVDKALDQVMENNEDIF